MSKLKVKGWYWYDGEETQGEPQGAKPVYIVEDEGPSPRTRVIVPDHDQFCFLEKMYGLWGARIPDYDEGRSACPTCGSVHYDENYKEIE